MIARSQRVRSGNRLLRWACGCLIVSTGVGLLISWQVGSRLVAPARSIVGEPPADVPCERISLASDSGATIAGWHLAADGQSGVVVLLHSIRGSRRNMVERARLFLDAGYSVVMIDLQAHGESSGSQITLGYLESRDVRAAVTFAKSQHTNEPVAVLGTSLGGAAAILASPLEIDAMVIESVCPTIAEAVHNRVEHRLGIVSAIPSALLLAQLRPRLGISSSELSPIDRVGRVGCPILVMSGSDDYHTTSDETRRLFTAAEQPKELWIVSDAAHEDLHSFARTEYTTRVLSFLRRHMPK